MSKRAPMVANQTLTVADTEYSYTLPNDTRSFFLRARNNRKIQVAFEEGTSGSTYFSVGEGITYYEDELYVSGGKPVTLYFQCAIAGEVLEIVLWR